jgi:hypothetical protein
MTRKAQGHHQKAFDPVIAPAASAAQEELEMERFASLFFYWISKLNVIFKIMSFGGLTDLAT